MSIAHVKEQLRDIPGVADLTMDMQAGQCVYSVGGHTVTLPASTPDVDAAAAIRATLVDSAAKPASIIPMTDPTPLPAVAFAPATAPAVAPPAGSTPGAHALTIKDALAGHSAKLDQILQAQLALLQVTLDDQISTVKGGTDAVIANVRSHTDNFKAILGQFSNQVAGL